MTDPDLRRLLLSAAPDVNASDPVRLVRQRLRRRRVAAGGASAVAAVGALVVAATLLVTPGDSTQPDSLVAATPTAEAEPIATVPFVRRPYPPFGSRGYDSPTEPDCASQFLQAAATTGPSAQEGAAGVAVQVRVTNTGRTACQVPVAGQVRLQDPDGRVLQQGQIGSGRYVARPLPPPVPPGGAAVLTGSWSDGCGLPSGRPLSVVLTLQRPTGGASTVIASSLPEDAVTPECRPDDKVVYADGTLSLYDLVVVDDQLRRVDNQALSLTADLVQVPPTVEQNSQLAFGVRLHNPTEGPIALTAENCPLYAVTLNRNGGAAFPAIDGTLNCQDAPDTIPAGRSVVFELAFDVPAARYGAGAWQLSWTRTDGGGAPLTATVEVTARG
jgi:hypothetical protein